jgi:hypothetical protein
MNIQQFKFSESFNDSKGKSSIGLVAAFIMVVVASIVFGYAGFIKYGEGMMYATGFATLGAGLLGIRRFTKDKDIVSVEGAADDKKESV